MSDGYELYSQFRSSIQDVKETACEYLQRLHLLALKATQREGMRKQDIWKEVIRQFESSCADEDLLNRNEETLPSVDEVLLLVRTEESRRKEKKLRLKARNAKANMLKVQESDMATEMASLQKKVEALTQLQGQMTLGTHRGGGQPGTYSASVHQPGAASFHKQPQRTVLAPKRGHGFSRSGQGGQQPGRGRRTMGFCFLCCQDGHFQAACSFPRNAELVQQRLLASVQRTD